MSPTELYFAINTLNKQIPRPACCVRLVEVRINIRQNKLGVDSATEYDNISFQVLLNILTK